MVIYNKRYLLHPLRDAYLDFFSRRVEKKRSPLSADPQQ
jgi:hypothetical protein